ncbi:hypothetical protein AMTR_s00136p00101100 [Amborella trichopoda]|uniref:Uncharacterized protein n=1 Tax=Amborella trichopoda TaxID=13333 RepID=W1NFP1_AMBTC|nr:hypothetical protein AMTR_s00136p00101100 [Amborella trichopoda]
MHAPTVPHRSGNLKARSGSGRSRNFFECFNSKGSLSHSAPAMSKLDLVVYVMEVLKLRQFQCSLWQYHITPAV